MEMARYEREATANRNYGREIALRELNDTNRLTELRNQTKEILNKNKNVILNSLPDEENNKLEKHDEIKLNDWEDINVNALRSIALMLGPHLLSVSFSSCQNLNDIMLQVICSRLFSLQKLDLSFCSQVGDSSCCIITKFCGDTLTDLNLSKCKLITNRAFGWLAGAFGQVLAKCKKLQFLDASYNSNINDKGIHFFKKGCHKLNRLNLIGCEQITIKGINFLLKNCRQLTTLNVTKCHKISKKSLLDLIDGLNHIREATSFFGYLPMDKAHDPRIIALRRKLENQCAQLIQNLFLNHRLRHEAKLVLANLRFNKYALDIQLFYQRYCQRKYHWDLKQLREKHMKATLIQSCVRKNIIRQRFKHILGGTSAVVKIQTIFRGFSVRKNDATISPALMELRRERYVAKRLAATVLIQSFIRTSLAKSRFKKEKKLSRIKSMSTLTIQNLFRVYKAKCCLVNLKYQANLLYNLQFKSACLIQKMFRCHQNQKSAKYILWSLRERKRLRNITATCIQSVVRGHFGRRKVSEIRENRMNAATYIQKIVRGARVIEWKYARINKACTHILQRQQREIEFSAESARNRLINNDGCDEDEAIGSNEMQSNITTSDKDVHTTHKAYEYERSMLGLKCQIYWPLNQKYFTGTITKYNPRKEKWLVVYDDQDREWINLKDEQDRVLLFANDSWKTLDTYEPLSVKNMREMKAKMKQIYREQLEKKKIALSWVPLLWDEERKRYIYYSHILKKSMCSTEYNNFDDWEIVDDKCITLNDPMIMTSAWYFKKLDNSENVSWEGRDPRLEEMEDTYEQKVMKENLLAELRYVSFIGRGVLEKLLEKISKSNEVNLREKKPVLSPIEKEELSDNMKHMGALLSQSRKVWNMEVTMDFPEKEELDYFRKLQLELAKALDM